MAPYAEFSEECSTILLYQNLFCDHYPFRYKLPIQWDSRKRQIAKRQNGSFWNFLPLSVMFVGFVTCFIALVELNSYKDEEVVGLGRVKVHCMQTMLATACGIFTF